MKDLVSDGFAQVVKPYIDDQDTKTREMLAPVEPDETNASRAYAVGEQLILKGILYKVIDPIAEHGIITPTGSGANIALADTITSEAKALKEAFTNQSKVNGAVNMMPITATSQVINGITWTIDEDGTITATGSVSEGANNSQLTISNLNGKISDGRYRLTGCPSGGADNKYYLYINTNGDTSGRRRDSGNGTTLNYTNDSSNTVYIRIYPGVTTPLVFKPMISIPSMNLQYDDYVPYAKSNKELTEDVDGLVSNLGNVKKIAKSIAKNTSATITFSGADRFILLVTHADLESLNYIGFGGASASATSLVNITTPPNDLVITESANTITITNNSTSTLNLGMIDFNGLATVA